MNNKKISSKRKLIYQIGVILNAMGFVLFISVFITGALNFGNFDNFEQRAQGETLRAISGLLLFIAGNVLRNLGRKGVAGSGFVLDTEKERKDLEPINRMLGGQLSDALEEADLKGHLGQEPIIKIKCPACNHLNDQHDKYCGGCGKQI